MWYLCGTADLFVGGLGIRVMRKVPAHGPTRVLQRGTLRAHHDKEVSVPQQASLLIPHQGSDLSRTSAKHTICNSANPVPMIAIKLPPYQVRAELLSDI